MKHKPESLVSMSKTLALVEMLSERQLSEITKSDLPLQRRCSFGDPQSFHGRRKYVLYRLWHPR